MTILSKSFFALVGGHLVSLVFLSVRHNSLVFKLLINELFLIL